MKETLLIITLISVMSYSISLLYELFNNTTQPIKPYIGLATIMIYSMYHIDKFLAICLLIFHILYMILFVIIWLHHYKHNKH